MTLPAVTQVFARQLITHLPQLVGDIAPDLQQQLEMLLQDSPSPENQDQILALLQPYPAARHWLEEQSEIPEAPPEAPAMSSGPERGYSPLAGDRQLDTEVEIRYICPVDTCTEDYFAQSSREAAPLCEKHGVVMVRDTQPMPPQSTHP